MMIDKPIDRLFLDDGVVFLPWVGSDYELGFAGRRLLVLGESHYDEWDKAKHVLSTSFTRDCIREVIDRDVKVVSFWKYIEQALLNERRVDGWAPSGGSLLWNKLSFYNFVQSHVPGSARVPPTRQMFENSHRPFRKIIDRLRPERILVCGKRLWRNMEPIEASDQLDGNIQAYKLLGDSKAWCFATAHPSSGSYSWSSLHPLIMAFLENPEEAAASLQKT